MKNNLKMTLSYSLILSLSACNVAELAPGVDASSVDGGGVAEGEVPRTDSGRSNGGKRIVCDPFKMQANSTPPQIRGTIYGDIPDAHHSTHNLFEHYFEKNEQGYEKYLLGDVILRFSAINILPRNFATGFPISGTGSNPELLRSESTGEPLVEYFGLKLDTFLKLAENDVEGDYEFAIISDDGASMKFDEDSADWIREESVHPPIMTCAAGTKNFTRDTKRKVKFQYFQSPRYLIAFALLMRPAGSAPEYFCGRDPQSGYPYAAVPEMGDTLHPYFVNNGWKMVEPANFELPAEYADEGSCE